MDRLHQFITQLKNVERIEVLPYHTLGAYKWKELGLEYPLEGIPRQPINNFKLRIQYLKQGNDYPCFFCVQKKCSIEHFY